jgi:phosphoribosylanthranilate isomerase
MLSYTKIKFCGLSNNDDVACAYEQKAYWAGFVFEKGSTRYIEFDKSKNIIMQFKDKIKFVGVFVNPSNEHIAMGINSGINYLQLHGSETVERCEEIKSIFNIDIIKAIPIENEVDLKLIKNYSDVCDSFLFDTKNNNKNGYNGGTGKTFNWNIIKNNKLWLDKQKPWILSGGLNLSNIKEAIKFTGTKAIDVSSGIEYNLGIKSKKLMKLFAQKVHNLENKVKP